MRREKMYNKNLLKKRRLKMQIFFGRAFLTFCKRVAKIWLSQKGPNLGDYIYIVIQRNMYTYMLHKKYIYVLHSILARRPRKGIQIFNTLLFDEEDGLPANRMTIYGVKSSPYKNFAPFFISLSY